MNLAVSKTRAAIGMIAQTVSVEVHLSNGLPQFTMVGLAQVAVKESKDRVRSAILNSQYEFPCRRITVNLAPANLPKAGGGFDLPIAIGILAASGQISAKKLQTHELIGELALSGELRGVGGIIPVVLAAYKEQQQLVIAAANAEEASLTGYKTVYIAQTLREVCAYLCDQALLPSLPSCATRTNAINQLDWSDVKGQQHAKLALEIAATGGHSILLSGPPGSGKTMLARRFNGLLPELTESQALECAAINSIYGRSPNLYTWRRPPFRSPHHTSSPSALVGGGNPPKPGEISLAHHGVLFLDELPEFNKHVLETLREPLETGNIFISRAAQHTEFPAKFQLVAAMNPCPCGHWGNPQTDCSCPPERINRYLGKLSGPLLDRIDMHIHLQPLSQQELIKPYQASQKQTEPIRQQVEQLRAKQWARQACLNSELNAKDCERVCALEHEEQGFLRQVIQQLKLSARGYHRLLKVARTIADREGEERVHLSALQQALTFKQTLTLPK